MSASDTQKKIDSIVEQRDKKLDIVSRVSPTLYNDPKTRQSISDDADEQINAEIEKHNASNQTVSNQTASNQQTSQPEPDTERQELAAKYDRKIEQLENQKQTAIQNLPTTRKVKTTVGSGGGFPQNDGTDVTVWVDQPIDRSQRQVMRNQVEQNYNSQINTIKRDKTKALNYYDYSHEYPNRPIQGSVAKTFKKTGGQVSLVKLQQNKDAALQSQTESQSQTGIKNAQSAAIKQREDSAINLYESQKQNQTEKQIAQNRDVAKVEASIAAAGVSTSDLTKSGDLGIVFPATPQAKQETQSTEEKTKAILQNIENYKSDETPLTQPNASNYLPIEVPEPEKNGTSFTEYYQQWNQTHPQQPTRQQPNVKQETITKEKSEQILNQYFLYKHGLSPLTDDVASNGKPIILPTPKKEDVQNERNASEFYRKWSERYGNITREDIETAGILTDPDKLQRVKELNMQQKNMPVDPAVLLLKNTVDKIAEIKQAQELHSTITENDKSHDVKIVRDGLIIVKNEKYAAIQTPRYTRLVVYPTEDKEGYVQIISAAQQKPSYYVFDENLDDRERQIQIWKTANFLLEQSAEMPTENDKKFNQYIQQNKSSVIAAESDPTKQGDVSELSDNDFFKGLMGHATELHVTGQSVIEYAKGGTQEEIEGRIEKFQHKMNYDPTVEASVVTDIVNEGRHVLFGEPKQQSQTVKVVESSSIGKLSGSIVGTVVLAAVPVGKAFDFLKPLTKIKTTKTSVDIAKRTIPEGVAYSVEVDKNIPSRAIVWVGSEEATKQTIRTRPTEHVVADTESGTGRASFDAIKIDTKAKTAEFIKISEAADKDKIISEIRLESRGTKTPKKLGLEQYDTQGKFEYSQGTSNFKNIWDLSQLEKQKEMKQLATGVKYPLDDVKMNAEYYGDIPIYSTRENAAARFKQWSDSLEGGAEPRIAGRVGYFVERPKSGTFDFIEVPPDVLAKLNEPEPLGLRARTEQRNRNEELIKEYFEKNPRTYADNKESQKPTEKKMKPFTYDDIESEMSKMTRDANDTHSKSKQSAETQTKDSVSMSEIKKLLSFESKQSESSVVASTPKTGQQSKSKINYMPRLDTNVDVIEKMMSDTVSKIKIKYDTSQQTRANEKLTTKQKQVLDEDLDFPLRLILDPTVALKQDVDFMPRLLQKTKEVPPEKLILDIPEMRPPDTPPFRLFLFDESQEKIEEAITKFKFGKRSYLTNVPEFSSFGLLEGDDLIFGKESKLNKIEKKRLKWF